MPEIVKRYRRRRDGAVVEAVQYGLPGRFDAKGASTIAKFMLGLDVDTQVGIANEHMLDVVVPDGTRWFPREGTADIYIIDQNTGLKLRMELGDWVCRDVGTKSIMVVKNAAFRDGYTEAGVRSIDELHNELSDIIYGSFSNLEGELYRALAEQAATAVIKAGWKKGS